MNTEEMKLTERVAIELLKELKKAFGFGKYKEGHWEAMTEPEKQTYLQMANSIIPIIQEQTKREILDKMVCIRRFDHNEREYDVWELKPSDYEALKKSLQGE